MHARNTWPIRLYHTFQPTEVPSGQHLELSRSHKVRCEALLQCITGLQDVHVIPLGRGAVRPQRGTQGTQQVVYHLDSAGLHGPLSTVSAVLPKHRSYDCLQTFMANCPLPLLPRYRSDSSSLALSWHMCTACSHHMHLLSPDAQQKAAATKHSRSTPMRIRWHIEKISRHYHAQAVCSTSLGFFVGLAKADYESPFIADAQQLASWGTTNGLLHTHIGRYSQRLLASAPLQSI